jgi:putative glutamine amidotransferase
MSVRILIPVPTSSDAEYNQRSLPAYVAALEAAGASAVVADLDKPPEEVAKLVAGADGVLLPGSRYDVDPRRYGEDRRPECGEADPARTAVDELLLQEAFAWRKPVLAICHGAQTLNVWRRGSLIQDLQTQVNHRPGRDVAEAHPVHVAQNTRLSDLILPGEGAETHVNSSHHQAIRVAGDNLVVSAVSPGDGVIEAVELDAPDHFVLAVQWHPERTYAQSRFSRAIFAAFVDAARKWQPLSRAVSDAKR